MVNMEGGVKGRSGKARKEMSNKQDQERKWGARKIIPMVVKHCEQPDQKATLQA